MPRLVMVATCHTRGSNLRKYGPFVLLVVCPDARKILYQYTVLGPLLWVVVALQTQFPLNTVRNVWN